MSDKFTTVLAKTNLGKVGSNLKIISGFYYRYPRKIAIGNNVFIGSKCSFTSEGLSTHYLKIEDGVSIAGTCKIDFTGGVLIKKDAHLAHEVFISTHDHGYDYKSVPVGKPLEIGENAFVGSYSKILHNCNYIGKNAVIGTGSIVTKDVPDNAIVAGNPARIIKYIK